MHARVVLSGDTSSAGAARRFTRDTLEAWGLDTYVHSAMLLVSELVTNAVLHARSGAEVVIVSDDGRVRIEVHDSSVVMPSRRHYGVEAGTGRGILLVEEMASDWGAEPTGNGKVVWFELRPGDRSGGGLLLDAEMLSDLAELSGAAGLTGSVATPASELDVTVVDEPIDRIECLAGAGGRR